MDELNAGQEKIADRIAVLLADSPMDEVLKNEILDNLDKFPEYLLVELLRVLTDQDHEFAGMEQELSALMLAHEDEWKDLATTQKATADSIVNDAIAQAEKGDQMEALADSVLE